MIICLRSSTCIDSNESACVELIEEVNNDIVWQDSRCSLLRRPLCRLLCFSENNGIESNEERLVSTGMYLVVSFVIIVLIIIDLRLSQYVQQRIAQLKIVENRKSPLPPHIAKKKEERRSKRMRNSKQKGKLPVLNTVYTPPSQVNLENEQVDHDKEFSNLHQSIVNELPPAPISLIDDMKKMSSNERVSCINFSDKDDKEV